MPYSRNIIELYRPDQIMVNTFQFLWWAKKQLAISPPKSYIILKTVYRNGDIGAQYKITYSPCKDEFKEVRYA